MKRGADMRRSAGVLPDCKLAESLERGQPVLSRADNIAQPRT